MPRPKKIPDYVEGPQAFDNFRRLAQRIVRAGRPTVERTETEERTEEVRSETVSVERREKGRRK